MFWSKALRRSLQLPSRLALMLGLGALFSVAGQADARPAQDHAAADDLCLRIQDGEVYVSERGGDFHRLQLGNSVEARALRQLLEGGNAGIPTRLITLAGTGGSGFHWAPAQKPADGAMPNRTAAPPPPNAGNSPSPHQEQRKSLPKTTLGDNGRNG